MTGLDWSELSVLDKLTEAHNEFMKLPVQHSSDIPEWVVHFHALQRIVMSRCAVKNHPDVFTNLAELSKQIYNKDIKP